jgi:hypothetical protein
LWRGYDDFVVVLRKVGVPALAHRIVLQSPSLSRLSMLTAYSGHLYRMPVSSGKYRLYNSNIAWYAAALACATVQRFTPRHADAAEVKEVELSDRSADLCAGDVARTARQGVRHRRGPRAPRRETQQNHVTSETGRRYGSSLPAVRERLLQAALCIDWMSNFEECHDE